MAVSIVIWPKELDYFGDFFRIDPTSRKILDTGTEIHAAHYQGFDMHVLRNNVTTRDLRKYVVVVDEDSLSADMGVYRLIDALDKGLVDKAEFLPALEGGLIYNDGDAAVDSGTHKPPGKAMYALSIDSNVDIEIDTYSGEITAKPTTNADYLKNYNFTLLIRITVGTQKYESAVRVHVHEKIDYAWITPSTLTVRKGDKARFSMYAQFGEGIVGDISRHPDISWTPPSGITMETDDNNEQTGLFTVASNAANGTMDAAISNNLTITGGGSVLSGEVIVQESWADMIATRPKAHLVSGPGLDKLEEYPNFLFLSEGFPSAIGATTDIERRFRLIIDDICKNQFKSASNHPWNVLRDRINMFRLWIPSAGSGVSVLNEFLFVTNLENSYNFTTNKIDESTIFNQWSINEYVREADNFFDGFGARASMPKSLFLKNASISVDCNDIVGDEFTNTSQSEAQRNANISRRIQERYGQRYNLKRSSSIPANELNLSRLISKVGYPTPNDESLGYANIFADKWNKIYDSGLSSGDVPADLFSYWISMSQRRMLDEVDSIFRSSLGKKPIEDFQFGSISPTWFTQTGGNPSGQDSSRAARTGSERGGAYYRVTRDQIDVLLKDLELKDDAGNTESAGNIWIKDGNSFGKDFDFVVFIQNHTRYGGVISYEENGHPDGIFVNLEGSKELNFKDEASTGPAKRNSVKAIVPATSADSNVFNVISHELGHGLRLADEYGNAKGNYNRGSTKLNVQPRTDVLSSGQISGDKLKWRWLRLAAAGVVTTITPGSGNHVLTLKKGHAAEFKEGDKLFLRARVLQPRSDNNLQLADFGSEMIVSAPVDKENDLITVTGLSTGDLTTFTPPTMLVKLVEANVVGKGKIGLTGLNITGTDTIFNIQVAVAGSVIVVDGFEYTVSSVSSNTSLTISTPPSGHPTSFSNKSYTIIPKDKYAELLNHSVRQAINFNKRSMTANITTGACEVDINDSNGELPQEAKRANLLVETGGSDLFKLMSNIGAKDNNHVIALYDGGDTFLCGIYHPTGQCNMRSKGSKTGFCQVCRYIMIDQIDPSRHGGQVENFAHNNYPDI